MSIIKQTINQNKHRIWGSFIVEEGKRKYNVKFENKKNEAWFQWGAPTEILCETMPIVDELCQEWALNY